MSRNGQHRGPRPNRPASPQAASRNPAGRDERRPGPRPAAPAPQEGPRDPRGAAAREEPSRDSRGPRQPGKAAGKPSGKGPARAAGGNALLFGIHPVAAAWTNPERRIRRLLATEAALEALAPALAEAAAKGLSRPAPGRTDRATLDRMLPDAVHQGAVLDAAPLPELDLADLIRAGAARERDVLVLLDQVTDPHNVGAILRSAAAFGASGVVLPDRNAPEVTGTLAKSASGALEVVPLVRVVNLARALTELRDGGYWCVGLDESGPATLAETRLDGRVAIVLGAEGSGLRRLTMERCDAVARLPTRGPIGSLNVSNAAAVALYEIARLG
ncbi:23S rRNA (guanosine(2251)-2'-O)-methyltransferase RlmB [Arenibaculum pallidiluteum]|uniref:23S rRNA (guanosine(2251)-2'-O)-methyltransferase RlmB n=1 Tax=Arenibaculum pallidiluteum TaxID=2812559 RepID=UPI001A95C0A9|nr:23S rRNA (guanosine(2251)-2'-O)-methyltransferase RlmB [Arenibaculum pallidiluteum]